MINLILIFQTNFTSTSNQFQFWQITALAISKCNDLTRAVHAKLLTWMIDGVGVGQLFPTAGFTERADFCGTQKLKIVRTVRSAGTMLSVPCLVEFFEYFYCASVSTGEKRHVELCATVCGVGIHLRTHK